MFELSVNLEYMFQEAGENLTDRVAAAAAAGFRKVEIFTTGERDVPALAKALKQHGVKLWTVVADPRTKLVDPSTHETFLGIFRRAASDARLLGCSRVVVGSGPAVPYQKRQVQLETVTRAVGAAVAVAEELDVTILIEAVNTRVDHPGVLFSETADAVAVVEGIGSPRVRLLYDMYHSIAEGEEPAEVLPRVIGLVEHVQIADAPGRGEPGSGNVDWERQLGLLRDVGYRGVVGVECHPTKKSTADALKHIRALAAH
jgi:hydroxypyruvate isomerase